MEEQTKKQITGDDFSEIIRLVRSAPQPNLDAALKTQVLLETFTLFVNQIFAAQDAAAKAAVEAPPTDAAPV